MPVVNIPEIGKVRFPDDLSTDEINEKAARVYDVNVRIPKLKSEITTNLQEAQNRSKEAGAYKLGEYAARAVDIFGAINWLGDVAAGFATDLIQGRVLPSPSRGAIPNLSSTGAAIVEQPDTSVNAQLTPAQSGLVEAARTTPTIAAGMAAQSVGVPAPLAFGTVMGGTTLSNTGDPVEAGKSAVVGAVIPGVGQATKALAGRAVASAVNRGIISAENVTAQKLIEASAEFAGIASFIEALNIPGYMSMGPGERSDAFAKSLASQLAFLPMSIMGLRGGRLSETQKALAGEPTIPTYTPEPPPPRPQLLLQAPAPEPRGPIITPPPAGKPTMTQIEMAIRDLAIKARQTVPEPAKREAQREEIPIVGQRPVTIEQQLILPERFMQADAKRDNLMAEAEAVKQEFQDAAKSMDLDRMEASKRQLEAIYEGLNKNRADLDASLEGEYPPTAEQLGTFQSRARVPELSGEIVPQEARIGSEKLPTANRPETTRLTSSPDIQAEQAKVYPETTGVVPPESLRAELPLDPGFPPSRPPKLGGVPEGEQRSGIIRGSDLERWADKVISEDPRAGGLLMQMDPKAEVRRAAAWAVKGAAVIEGGIRDFAAWSAEMVRQFGEGIRPSLEDIYKKSDKYLQAKTAQQAQEGGQTPTQSAAAKPEISSKPFTELVKGVQDIPNEQLAAHPGGATQFMWDLGAKAKTPADVAALRRMAEEGAAEFRRMVEAGDMDGAMRVAGRQPAEAYEYATGVKLDGTPKWKMFEDMAARRGQTYRPAVPDAAYTKAKSESPTPSETAPKAAKPAGSEKPRERDKPQYNDTRSQQELTKAGLDFVNSDAGKEKYTPAVMARNGDIFTGETQDAALAKMEKAGQELATKKSVGYVSKDNPEHFLNLEGIAKQERKLEQDAIQGKTTEVPSDVQAQPGKGQREVPPTERPPTDAPPPEVPPPGPPSGGARGPVEPQPPRGGGPGETQNQAQGQEVLGQKPLRPLGEIYSEPFAERIRRLGGPVADRVARDTQRIVDNAKRMYGELSSNILDRAKRMSGRAFRGGTTWMNGKTDINPRAAVGRMFTALETYNQTGNWNHVPAGVRPLAQVLYDANLAIGNLRNSGANPIGQAHDVMRLVTPWGVDVIRRGTGRAWNALIDGYAQANGQTRAYTEQFFRDWKAALDQPVPSATTLDQISRNFVAQFPNAVTHLRPILGWHEFLQAAPFHYLEQSGQRVANTVAFQQVYPPGTGALNRTREAVQAEVRTDSGMAEFDNMTRALRGYPTDVAANWYNAPDTLVGALSRTAGMALRPLKSGLLTQSLGTNVGETLAGGVGIFLGYGRLLNSMYQNGQLRAQMIRSGMMNRAIRDFSFDPTKPVQSVSKYASNLISRGFLNDLANEFQEFTAANAARTVANEIRNGTLPANDVRLVQNTMRMMGFTKQQAIDAVAGRNPDVVNQFETKAAEALTSGNQILAEKSRLGSSRTFNQLFWFQSYPMLKLRQARSILNNVIEDAHEGDWRGAASNATLFGKFVGGTAMSGAITTGLLATLKEGLYGLGIRKQEAQDDFGRFVLNSFLMGMGGPLSTFSKVMEESGSIPQFRENVEQAALESLSPYGLYKNIERAGAGIGEYEGLDTFERIGKFLEAKTPGLKPFKAAMASYGLIQDDPKLDSAISAYYRWSRREIGVDKTEIRRFNDDRKEVRGYAKQVVNAVRDGKDFGEPLVKEIIAAAGTATDNPYASAASSIRGKQIIGAKVSDGKLQGKLSIEELEALKNHIGEDPVNRIMAYDAMLDSVADYVAGLK